MSEQTQRKLDQLVEIVANAGKLLIFTHPHPDPDTLASAFALYRIAAHLNTPATIYITSELGRPENKAMVKQLRIPVRRTPSRIPKGVRALVDAQPTTHVPKGIRAFDIAFDHHPLKKKTTKLSFWDVRPNYGACSSILTEYLQALGVKPDRFLATALFYGIKTDVGELARQIDESDIRAMQTLFPHISHQLLRKIERPRLPLEFFTALYTGMNTATIHGKLMTARLPKGSPPEIAALLADWLLRAKGTSWSFCATEHRGRLYFSLRSIRAGKRAGEIAARLVGHKGTGGGHHMSAGGHMILDRTSFDEAYSMLVERLKGLLGLSGTVAKRLIQEEP